MGIFSYFRSNAARLMRQPTGVEPMLGKPVGRVEIGENTSMLQYGTGKASLLPGTDEKISVPAEPSASMDAVTQIALEIVPQGFHYGKFIARFKITQQVLSRILEEAGGISKVWPKADIDAEIDDFTKWQHTQQLLMDYHIQSATRRIREEEEAFAQAVQRGENPKPSEWMANRHDLGATQGMIDSARRAIRLVQSRISRSVYQRRLTKCRLLQRAAEKLVVSTYKSETAQTDQFGLGFTPSPYLLAIIDFALRSWEDEVSNYISCFTGTLAPKNTFFGVKLFDILPSDSEAKAADERKRILAEGERRLADHLASVGRRQAENQAQASASKLAQVAAISAQNDQLRAEAEAFAAELRNARPVQVVRIVQ